MNNKNEIVSLPLQEVLDIDVKFHKIQISSATAAIIPIELERKVLLVRDVLDALILDLQNRRATRANDLWLEKSDS